MHRGVIMRLRSARFWPRSSLPITHAAVERENQLREWSHARLFLRHTRCLIFLISQGRPVKLPQCNRVLSFFSSSRMSIKTAMDTYSHDSSLPFALVGKVQSRSLWRVSIYLLEISGPSIACLPLGPRNRQPLTVRRVRLLGLRVSAVHPKAHARYSLSLVRCG